MFWEDSDNDKKKKSEEEKFVVEEEKLQTVFEQEKTEENGDSEPEKRYQVQSQIIEEKTQNLSPITVSKEMKSSFLSYAMSVIVARALPDAKDGLKPVHRRILYGMHELGLTSSATYKKSARIVGDVLGKYHPHGDSSVYEAMVRMSQDFSMRYPMVDGHGNFGSIDGDGAAAMRYTEARMSKIASLMVDAIKKDTVKFLPNYDESEQEPLVLPARIPNLLATGATGIAVGMATSIPPHNLEEVINGAIHLAKNPETTTGELTSFVKGPDFPTGALILGTSGIQKAYETGNGSVTIRSKTHIEELKNGKSRIVVSEIPYMVNKAKMIEKIAALVKNKVVEGIVDLRDETSRRGIRVVIEIKKGFVPEVIQNKLFKLTQLQTNFSINMLALVDGQPKVLNLKDSLQVYLEHQYDIVSKRTRFDLTKAEDRAHILQGLKVAISNIENVIGIIRATKNDSQAQEKLANKYQLSSKQTKAIIDMRLGRLTSLAIDSMNKELEDLFQKIQSLKNILADHNVLVDLVVQELQEIKDKFADKRRSEITEVVGDIDDEDLIPQKDIAISMSSRGYVKRIPLEDYTIQNRGGVGSKSMTTYEDDNVETILTTTTHTDLLIFTMYGKVFRIRAHQIPEMSKQSKGIPFINLVDIQKDEKIVSLLATNDYGQDKFLFTITKKGVVKKTSVAEYARINRNGKRALGIRNGDMLVKAMILTNNDQIVIGSSEGKVVRFDASEVRSSGRTAFGVKGITLSNDLKSQVVGASSSFFGGYILSVGEDGFGKKTKIEEYRQTKRGAKGVKAINVSKAGYLKFVEVVKGNEDILIITKKGITIRTSLSQVATSGRSAKGVKVISLNDGNKIKSIAVFNTEEIKEQVEEAIRKTQELSLQNLKNKLGK